MKTFLLSLSLAVAGVSTGHAQIYHPTVVNGSILGGLVGAVVGGHNHDRWGEGAVIGAAAGALLGAAVEQPRTVVYQQPPVTVIQSVPTAATVPVAATVPTAPMVGAPVVVQQQPTQVVYVPYYEPAPVVYAYPSVSVGLGYVWGPRHYVYAGRGYHRW